MTIALLAEVRSFQEGKGIRNIRNVVPPILRSILFFHVAIFGNFRLNHVCCYTHVKISGQENIEGRRNDSVRHIKASLTRKSVCQAGMTAILVGGDIKRIQEAKVGVLARVFYGC